MHNLELYISQRFSELADDVVLRVRDNKEKAVLVALPVNKETGLLRTR